MQIDLHPLLIGRVAVALGADANEKELQYRLRVTFVVIVKSARQERDHGLSNPAEPRG